MAADTRSRRASAIRAFRPWMLALPLSDGTVDQADREHTAFGYAGILSGAAVGVDVCPFGVVSEGEDYLAVVSPAEDYYAEVT